MSGYMGEWVGVQTHLKVQLWSSLVLSRRSRWEPGQPPTGLLKTSLMVR